MGQSNFHTALLPDLLVRMCVLRQVTFASTADFVAQELQSVARSEWERQLLPFVPDGPSADQVLDDLVDLLATLPLDAVKGDEGKHAQ